MGEGLYSFGTPRGAGVLKGHGFYPRRTSFKHNAGVAESRTLSNPKRHLTVLSGLFSPEGLGIF